MQGTLYIVSAPSGAGKTSLVKALIAETDNIQVSISHTTRPKRPNETDGINYHFISQETFITRQAKSDFIECAEVFGNYYGTSKNWVLEQLNKGTDVILEIDWQGAEQIRKAFPEAVAIFILPPSLDTLEQRLQKRAQDKPEIIQGRLQEAQAEIAHYVEYDYLIVNNDFKKACHELKSVIESRRLTLSLQAKKLLPLLTHLLN